MTSNFGTVLDFGWAKLDFETQLDSFLLGPDLEPMLINVLNLDI